jgi:hypothetical protein
MYRAVREEKRREEDKRTEDTERETKMGKKWAKETTVSKETRKRSRKQGIWG